MMNQSTMGRACSLASCKLMSTSTSPSSLNTTRRNNSNTINNNNNNKRNVNAIQIDQNVISEDIEHLLANSIGNLTLVQNATSNNINNEEINDDSFFGSKNSNCAEELELQLEEEEGCDEAWYQLNMPREQVFANLIDQEIGAFVIRLSTSCYNCFALSIRVPYYANAQGIAHYLIIQCGKTSTSQGGYKLKGVEKEFKSLKSLVTHYSVMQEILPVTLNLHKNTSASSSRNNSTKHNNPNQNVLEVDNNNNQILSTA